jgi:putative peptide zinc metalloprotease protein
VSPSRRTTGLVPLVAATRPEETAAALAARHAPTGDRPALRKDAVVRRVVQMGQVTWVVKNPETVKYYYFEDSEWGLIELFDGTRTRAEIFEEYRSRFPRAGIELSLILDYEEMLRKTELVEQSVAEKNLGLLGKFKTLRQRAAEEKAEGFNPFFILFHVFDPNRFLDRTAKYVRWIWTPPVVAVWAVGAVWTVGVFIGHWAPIWTGTYELYAFLRKPLIDAVQFFLILSSIGLVHEMSHAYSTKIYGGQVHDIGIALLYFTPAFYCDTTDSLLFESKWERLWVCTAGIYIEGFLCSAATALWVASYPDTLLNELAYKTMLFTGVSTVFFNINPLIKIDGYYALSSVLEMSELREDSLRYLGAVFQRRVLRLAVEVPVVSRRKRRIYWIYGTLALAYTVVIMRFIGGLFFNFYSKYFPNVAIVLLIVTLYRLFRKRVRLATRTARLLYLDKKEWILGPKRRIIVVGAVAAAVLLLFVPWTRRRISSEAILRPATTIRIEAPRDAIVTEVLVGERDSVSRETPLFRLASLEAEADVAHFAAETDRFRQASRAAGERSDAAAFHEALRHEAASEAALLDRETRRRRLLVTSPIAGRVLTPRLEDLRNQFVAAGEALAEIGDDRSIVADLPVSERLLDDLSVGAPVRGFLPQRPFHPVDGKVVAISPATLDQPRTATGSLGPAPPQYPDRFVVRAVFENSNGQLRPGGLIRAKIFSRRSSYGARAWRILRRWLQTIFW